MKFNNIKFIDSFNFMAESLENLSKNNKNNLIYTNNYYKNNCDLICKKQLYPYEKISKFEDFDMDITELKKEDFFSKLKNEGINDEEYKHFQEVNKILDIKKFGDYHDLYLKLDVLLLCDVCENFRDLCYKDYKLDAFNYISSPGLAWDAMMLECKQPLGLIYDEEIRNFLKKRGGICIAGLKRHAKANNKYMKNYNKKLLSNFIIYLDMNGLYSKAMMDFLPYNLLGFDNKIKLNEILDMPLNGNYGYFVEVDIEIPENLHDKFKDYPPCPENISIKKEELSDYQKEILKINKRNYNGKNEKLILNLNNKVKYFCHFSYLQNIKNLGCNITKLHRALKFEQSEWMKPYIIKNQTLRANAKNKFEEDFYKLMNNSCYGKTMENVLQYEQFDIIESEKIFKNRVDKDGFKSAILLNGLYFINSARENIIFNKPIYIGCAILDLSKTYMLNFHYGFMKNYDNDLLYSDTDSLVYDVKHKDFYNEMYKNRNKFDLSKVGISEFNDLENHKINGVMKDETSMFPIKEWISLCPKTYSYILDDEEEYKNFCKKKEIEKHIKNKGVTKSTIKHQICHDDFKDIFINNIDKDKNMTILKSRRHQIFTENFNKKVLSSFDDKFYRISANEALPYGHYLIPK